MICRKEGTWHVYDPSTSGGKHLYLLNDATGGGIQNTKITADSRFSVDGYVDECDLHKPAHTQATAELLCSYGPHFNLSMVHGAQQPGATHNTGRPASTQSIDPRARQNVQIR